MKLKDAYAVVGGSTGVGEAEDRALAAEGARVTILALPSQELEKVATDVGVKAQPINLADLTQVDAAIEGAGRKFGPVDVLICNAAMSPSGPFESLTAPAA